MHAKWKITLECESDDGTLPDRTVISKTGTWESGDHPEHGSSRPMAECVAITMAFVARMLLESGHVWQSIEDFPRLAEAFSEVGE